MLWTSHYLILFSQSCIKPNLGNKRKTLPPFSMDPFPPGKKCNFEKIPKFPARSPEILSRVEKKCNFEKIPKISPTDPFPPGKKVQLWNNPEDFPRSPRILSCREKKCNFEKIPRITFPLIWWWYKGKVRFGSFYFYKVALLSSFTLNRFWDPRHTNRAVLVRRGRWPRLGYRLQRC